MRRADPSGGHLRDFVAALGTADDLVLQIDRLLLLAQRAVPTCVGLSVVVGHEAPWLTVTSLADGDDRRAVLSSLAVELPAPLDRLAGGARRLILYSSAARAFDAVAPAVLALLDMGPRRVTVDGHLELPSLEVEHVDLEQSVAADAVLARAMGVLLDRGILLEHGREELRRRAAAEGTTLVTAALVLLAETQAAKPDGSVTRPET